LPGPGNARELENCIERAVAQARFARKVLEAVKGNETLAAKVLGFDRRTLYRKLRAHEVRRVAPRLAVVSCRDIMGDS
jgi:transcriptional regulator of acetoin/glycerol metabolism